MRAPLVNVIVRSRDLHWLGKGRAAVRRLREKDLFVASLVIVVICEIDCVSERGDYGLVNLSAGACDLY